MTGPRIVAANPAGIDMAADLLRAGDVVAFPTETVYGLGADATNERAVARIFAAKDRPSFNPLIVHILDVAQAQRHAHWTDLADRLARRFWPGPLTLVLQRSDGCALSRLVSAGLDSVALRAPVHPVARAILSAADLPIAAPSANRSGAVSPTTAAHVASSLGARVSLIVDGGACPIGIESTVIDASDPEPVLLRAGGLALEVIEDALGRSVSTGGDGARPVSPGLLERHYAPRAHLRLEARSANAGETLLGFGPKAPLGSLNLSANGNLEEAAANLFAMLHRLDEAGVERVAVMAVPDVGLGRAVNDRLRRAAR